MGKNSKIEWCDHTWNPWTGCTWVSEGCDHCYMVRALKRFGRNPAMIMKTSDRTFYLPNRLKGGRVFVCSWSDFFHPAAATWQGEAFRVMEENKQCTFLLLTNRPYMLTMLPDYWQERPLSNVWLGVSVENEEYYSRIFVLKTVPAAKRFLSLEPLLGPMPGIKSRMTDIDWVIVGGESGPKARPMNLDWAREVRDACKEKGVPFFFKQVGGNRKIDGAWGGDKLDGIKHQEFPA